MDPRNSQIRGSQLTNQTNQEEEENKELMNRNPYTQETLQATQQNTQGQNELDQIAFELAHKIAKGQIRLKEIR